MQKYDDILSAKAWIIMNYDTGSYMRGSNVQKQRQIASLTKMYTLYGCLKINKLLNINPEKTFVKIHEIVNTGTTANLLKNRYISLRDLYYGMMLPSGNDAAGLLALYYGHWLEKETMFPNLIFTKQRKIDLKDKLKYSNLLTKKFMHFINQKIVKTQLQHSKTKLQNPHGLSNKFQVSTVWQIAEAAIHFMKNSRVIFCLKKQFRDIVSTKKYQGFYFSFENCQDRESFCWQNTNILLHQQGFEGVKTGHTSTAGSCLCTFKKIQIKNKYDYELIAVVLGCNGQQKRFSQTRIICDDLQNHLEKISY